MAVAFADTPLAHCRIPFYIVLFLLAAELGLEWRAHSLGYTTLLFGRVEQGGAASPGFPFRSPVVPQARRDGTLRLWIASASHAEDRYQPVDKIFPTRICAHLVQAGRGCEVLNASRAGTGIRDNTAELAERAPAWRPDVAILYQAKIDIDELSKACYGHTVPAGEAAEPLPHQRFLDRLRQGFEATTLYAHLTRQLKSRLMQARVLHTALPAAAEQAFAARLREFVNTCRGLGVRPVLATFAGRYRVDQLAQFDGELERSLLRYNPHLSAEGWLATIARFNAVIRSVAAAEGVTLVELAGPVAGESRYFRDFSHFTPVGHERVAAVLAEGLHAEPANWAREAAR